MVQLLRPASFLMSCACTTYVYLLYDYNIQLASWLPSLHSYFGACSHDFKFLMQQACSYNDALYCTVSLISLFVCLFVFSYIIWL